MTSLKLSKLEKEVLKQKYISNGFSWEQSQQNIDSITKYLENLVTTLKTKNKPIQDIESKFRKEFEKICQKAEVGRI